MSELTDNVSGGWNVNKHFFTAPGRTVTTGYSGLSVAVVTPCAPPTSEAAEQAVTDHQKCEQSNLDSFEPFSLAAPTRIRRVDGADGHHKNPRSTNPSGGRLAKATTAPLEVPHFPKASCAYTTAYRDGPLSPEVQKALDAHRPAGLDPAVYAWAERTDCLQPRAPTEAERRSPPDISELLPPF